MRRRLLLHSIAWVIGIAVLRVAVVPAEACPSVGAGEVTTSLDAALGWTARAVQSDGRFVYGYNRATSEVSAAYQEARHAGLAMATLQAAAIRGDRGQVAIAEPALAFMEQRLIDGPGWRAWALDDVGDVSLGANALYLAALAYRRDVTGDLAFDPLMRDIAGFLVSQQQSDGSMLAWWDRQSDAPLPDVFGPFATGEAMWALALMESRFPEEGWGGAALRTLDYVSDRRDRSEGYIAANPDHWAAYALAELGPGRLESDHVSYARRLAGFFGVRLRVEAQRTGEGINLWLRWHPGPGAGVGTAGEGLGALWRLAGQDDGVAYLLERFEQRLACTAGIIVDWQATGSGSPSDLTGGAWFYRDYTQLDDQQHVMSTLLAIETMMGGR